MESGMIETLAFGQSGRSAGVEGAGGGASALRLLIGRSYRSRFVTGEASMGRVRPWQSMPMTMTPVMVYHHKATSPTLAF